MSPAWAGLGKEEVMVHAKSYPELYGVCSPGAELGPTLSNNSQRNEWKRWGKEEARGPEDKLQGEDERVCVGGYRGSLQV